jgi:hypothetical protein
MFRLSKENGAQIKNRTMYSTSGNYKPFFTKLQSLDSTQQDPKMDEGDESVNLRSGDGLQTSPLSILLIAVAARY